MNKIISLISAICILIFMTGCHHSVPPGNIYNLSNLTNTIYHGGMWYYNETPTVLNFAVADTYYDLFMPNYDYLEGFSYQGGWMQPSNLTALNSGIYQVHYVVIGDGQNNHFYRSTVTVDNVPIDKCSTIEKRSAGSDIITKTGICFIRLNAGDVVSVKVMDVGGTGTGEYFGSNFNIIWIGD
jgi:hypothetical protein